MKLSSGAKTVLYILHKNGFDAYVVGGCVRDALRGKEPHDFDVTTNALPEEISRCFCDFRTVDTGIVHGTVVVVVDKENIEVTTFRIDGEYTDNRRPDSVSFTNELRHDLSRRDFTVNAMAYNEKTGVVDYFGGKDDLKEQIIRCVGDPVKRFNEDALRIMRAIRFSSVLCFEIEENTANALFSEKELLKNISVERIFSELKLLLMGENAQSVLTNFFSVIKVILTTADADCVNCIKRAPSDIFIRLALLLYGDENAGKTVLQSLHSDNKTIKNVFELLFFRNADINGEIPLRRLISRIGTEQTKRLLHMKYAKGEFDFDDLKTLLTLTDRTALDGCFLLKELAVSGKDIMNLGFKGEETGKILSCLLEKVIDKKLPNDKETLTEYIKSKNCKI